MLASTKWTCLDSTDEYSLLRLEPSTGRKHQLRIHCAESLNSECPLSSRATADRIPQVGSWATLSTLPTCLIASCSISRPTRSSYIRTRSPSTYVVARRLSDTTLKLNADVAQDGQATHGRGECGPDVDLCRLLHQGGAGSEEDSHPADAGVARGAASAGRAMTVDI